MDTVPDQSFHGNAAVGCHIAGRLAACVEQPIIIIISLMPRIVHMCFARSDRTESRPITRPLAKTTVLIARSSSVRTDYSTTGAQTSVQREDEFRLNLHTVVVVGTYSTFTVTACPTTKTEHSTKISGRLRVNAHPSTSSPPPTLSLPSHHQSSEAIKSGAIAKSLLNTFVGSYRAFNFANLP